ncbi:hypothetical protein [Mycobacteroides abscessus]|uniref:hypothetical protein n=1 Tax=Mycobacteroides abscessus TaxID=36809 RepID=UPI00094112B1|nr:hypothetical protein [Mycobacteroides abscessus]
MAQTVLVRLDVDTVTINMIRASRSHPEYRRAEGVEADLHVPANVYDSFASSITAPGDQALRALETTFEGHRTACPT